MSKQNKYLSIMRENMCYVMILTLITQDYKKTFIIKCKFMVYQGFCSKQDFIKYNKNASEEKKKAYPAFQLKTL